MDEETIGARIQKILEERKMKKVEFARKLNIDSSYVTQLIKGRSKPSVRLIEDICEKFGISARWLCSGEGNMEVELNRDDVIAAWAGKILHGDPENEFIRQFVGVLAKLDADDWKTIEKITKMMVNTNKNGAE